jgi:hypothetical protein
MRTTAPPSAASDPAADAVAVAATIADYYIGWYDGDPDRMARALHPELAKRGWLEDDSGGHTLAPDSSGSMVEATRRAVGRRMDPVERGYEIRAVEIHRDIASACVYAVPYVDYLHLVRTADGWRIVNALWCRP